MWNNNSKFVFSAKKLVFNICEICIKYGFFKLHSRHIFYNVAHNKMRLHYKSRWAILNTITQDELNNTYNYLLRATGTLLTKNQELLLTASICINIKILYEVIIIMYLYMHFVCSKAINKKYIHRLCAAHIHILHLFV